jgi:hypothetical protein
MANIDAFSAQIVEMVRNMPAEAILSLVRNQLGALGAMTGGAALGGRGRGGRGIALRGAGRATAAAEKSGRGRGGRRGRRGPSAARNELLEAVEKLVKGGSGMSSSEVAAAAGVPQPRVASALKELKIAKRIFQGGDRRFARYAGDARSATAASLHARETASGPMVKGRSGAGRRRGRPAGKRGKKR